ncbi:MAG: hypothetical protein V1838_04575 [Patescibacteria group bacterium]
MLKKLTQFTLVRKGTHGNRRVRRQYRKFFARDREDALRVGSRKIEVKGLLTDHTVYFEIRKGRIVIFDGEKRHMNSSIQPEVVGTDWRGTKTGWDC